MTRTTSTTVTLVTAFSRRGRERAEQREIKRESEKDGLFFAEKRKCSLSYLSKQVKVVTVVEVVSSRLSRRSAPAPARLNVRFRASCSTTVARALTSLLFSVLAARTNDAFAVQRACAAVSSTLSGMVVRRISRAIYAEPVLSVRAFIALASRLERGTP